MDSEIIILIISCILILVGAKLWQKGNDLIVEGKVAEAIVFKNNFKSYRGETGLYFPIVRFTTDKDEWVTQELSIGYLPAIPEGSKIEVIYDPDDLSTVEENSTIQLVWLPRLLVVLGATGFTW